MVKISQQFCICMRCFLPLIVSDHWLPYIPDIVYETRIPAWSHIYIALRDCQPTHMQGFLVNVFFCYPQQTRTQNPTSLGKTAYSSIKYYAKYSTALHIQLPAQVFVSLSSKGLIPYSFKCLQVTKPRSWIAFMW